MLRSDHILALDIGASSLKLGHFIASKTGSLELLRYAVRELDADPAHEDNHLLSITAALQDIVHELRLPAMSPVLVSVPGQSVFSRFVKLPPVNREKVLQIVQYEAQQNVPFPINEVIWDYQLIGSGSAEMDVMIAAIKAEMIGQITDAVVRAGLQPDLVDVAPMAIYNAVRFNYVDLPACALVIDVGARSTDLIFIEENRVFNRSIPIGGNTITQQLMREFELSFEDAEKLKRQQAYVGLGGAYEAPESEVEDKVSKSVRSIMTRLHAEITRSINFYRTQQSGSEPGRILLTGGSSTLQNFDTFLKEKLRVDVDYFNPFQNVTVDAAIPAEAIGGQAHLMGEVVGLALRRTLTCPIELNLLPPRFQEQKTFRHKQPFFIAAMVCAVLAILVWALTYFKVARLAHEQLAKIEGTVNVLGGVEGRLAAKERELKALQERGARLAALPPQRTQWIQILDEIQRRLPDGLWLTRIAPAAPPEAAAGGGMPPGLPPGTGGPSAPQVISALEISGYAYADKLRLKVPAAPAAEAAPAEPAAAGTVADKPADKPVEKPAEEQSAILQFQKALLSSPWFTDKTAVTRIQPPMNMDDFVAEFTLNVVLKNPIAL